VDDQTDDQAVRRGALGHPGQRRALWSGHQTFHLVTADGLDYQEPSSVSGQPRAASGMTSCCSYRSHQVDRPASALL
jgi:hypothetical protein